MRRASALACALACWLVTLTASAVGVGGRAPEIGVHDLAGHSVTLSGLRGHVVIVDFWATYCEPCRAELPFLQRLYGQLHGDGLEIVAITSEHDRGAIDRFLQPLHLTFRVANDSSGAVERRYDAHTQPTSYIVDRHGIVRHVHSGYRSRDADTITSEVRALIAAH